MNNSCHNPGFDNKDFSSPHQSSNSNKGQWEKRLQTDINLAKQALSDALSFDHKPQNPNDPLSPSSSTITTHSQYSSGVYASSAENIARLLENFMKDTPKTVLPSLVVATERDSSPSVTGEGFDQCVFGFNSIDEGEDKPKVMDNDITQGSLSLFEKWLFDEQSYDMSLEGQEVLF